MLNLTERHTAGKWQNWISVHCQVQPQPPHYMALIEVHPNHYTTRHCWTCTPTTTLHGTDGRAPQPPHYTALMEAD